MLLKRVFRHQRHIALCPTLFTTLNLQERSDFVVSELQQGVNKYARLAAWHKIQGQQFLHEMMHLEAVGKPKSSSIPLPPLSLRKRPNKTA